MATTAPFTLGKLAVIFNNILIEIEYDNLYSVHGEVYSIQHYVIKFVSDLRQVCGFLRVLRVPPQIKLTATI
jgi:hypothetical protein